MNKKEDNLDFLKLNSNKNVHTLSVFVNNSPGVLARIAQVFSRRSFNIDSLVVSHSRDKRYSRMTIVINGRVEMLGQIIEQVNKLVDVIRCSENEEEDTVVQELALVKFKLSNENRVDAFQIISHFKAKSSDIGENSMIATIHGSSKKIDSFLKVMGVFEIIEVVRTGQIAMVKGEDLT